MFPPRPLAEGEAMTAVEYLDPPPGWFVLDVIKKEERGRDWVALMVDVHPDDLKNFTCARQRWFNIPGKHRNRDDACDALEDMMTTRH
jgi:hypothetical protein